MTKIVFLKDGADGRQDGARFDPRVRAYEASLIQFVGVSEEAELVNQRALEICEKEFAADQTRLEVRKGQQELHVDAAKTEHESDLKALYNRERVVSSPRETQPSFAEAISQLTPQERLNSTLIAGGAGIVSVIGIGLNFTSLRDSGVPAFADSFSIAALTSILPFAGSVVIKLAEASITDLKEREDFRKAVNTAALTSFGIFLGTLTALIKSSGSDTISFEQNGFSEFLNVVRLGAQVVMEPLIGGAAFIYVSKTLAAICPNRVEIDEDSEKLAAKADESKAALANEVETLAEIEAEIADLKASKEAFRGEIAAFFQYLKRRISRAEF